MLLVLDNFEHVAAAATVLAHVVAAAQHLKVLITSRERLQVNGEHTFLVSPLAVPHIDPLPQLEALACCPSVALFVDRARKVNHHFHLSSENASFVAELCARLDGLPLAIELAAARSNVLSPQMIVTRLGRCLDLLTQGLRDAPARQQTLRGTFNWSYELLNEREQTLFARLSIFVGGGTLEAIQAVCYGDDDAPRELLDEVSFLVNKHLVFQGAGPHDEPRFTMLETVREYAHERLRDKQEDTWLHRRFADYFVALAHEAQHAVLGPDQNRWYTRLENECENIRSVLLWATERDIALAVRLCVGLLLFWSRRGHLVEGRRWIETVLPHINVLAPELQAQLLDAAGVIAHNQGRFQQALEYQERSLLLQRQCGSAVDIAQALNRTGCVLQRLGRYEQARSAFTESLEVFRSIHDHHRVSTVLNNIGLLAQEQHNYVEAQRAFEASLPLAQQSGDTFLVGVILNNRALLLTRQGDSAGAIRVFHEALSMFEPEEHKRITATILSCLGEAYVAQAAYQHALSCFKRGLQFWQECGNVNGIVESIEQLAWLASTQQQFDYTARLGGAASAIRASIGAPRPSDEQYVADAALERAQAYLGASWDKMWNAGQQLHIGEAIADALRLELLAIDTPDLLQEKEQGASG